MKRERRNGNKKTSQKNNVMRKERNSVPNIKFSQRQNDGKKYRKRIRESVVRAPKERRRKSPFIRKRNYETIDEIMFELHEKQQM